MQLFQTIQKGFAFLGISSYQSMQANPFNRRILITLFSNILTIISYNVYLFRIATTFSECTVNIYSNSATFLAVVCYIIVVFEMRKIFQVIDTCERIAGDSLDHPESMAVFVQANERIEKFSEIVNFLLAKVAPVFGILPKCFVCLFIYFTTDLGNEALSLPLPMWFPFDSTNLTGYLLAAAWEYIGNAHIYCFVADLVALGVGGLLFTLAMTDDIKNNLSSLNKTRKIHGAQLDVRKIIHHSMQLHSNSKQLIVNCFTEVKQIILALFVWSFVSISASMLMIQLELSQPNTDIVVLFTAIFYAFIAFSVIIAACEVGQRITNAFEAIGNATIRYSWYLFPHEVKRILPMMLMNLQEPVELPIFGSFCCDRAAFKRVINTGFSYFMVLRRFG